MRQTHVLGFPTSFCEFSGSFSVPDNSTHASSNAVLVTLYVKHSISPDLFPRIRILGNGRISCCTNCVVTLSLLFALQKVPVWLSPVSCPNRNLFQYYWQLTIKHLPSKWSKAEINLVWKTVGSSSPHKFSLAVV